MVFDTHHRHSNNRQARDTLKVLLIRRGIYTYKKHPERGKRFTRNDARHA